MIVSVTTITFMSFSSMLYKLLRQTIAFSKTIKWDVPAEQMVPFCSTGSNTQQLDF